MKDPDQQYRTIVTMQSTEIGSLEEEVDSLNRKSTMSIIPPIRCLKYCNLSLFLCCTGSIIIAVLALIWGSTALASTRTSTSASSGYDPSSTELLFHNLFHNKSTCQETKIYPFLVGCPKTCKRAMNDTEPMYRMSMAWYFGMKDMVEGTAYSRGYNYQCPIEFVNNFRNASNQLSSQIKDVRNVSTKFQPIIHLSLNYLCCLRKNETDFVREIMYQWVLDNYPFKISIYFNQLQCWHERFNSVTNIIIADEESQYILLKMNQDIENLFVAKGIPMEVHRTDQMPFHITLLGIYRGKSETDIANNITDDIPYIYDIVSNLSTQMGTNWINDLMRSDDTSTGSTQQQKQQQPRRMLIQHAPKINDDPVVHAGIDPDKKSKM